jgi:Rieske 2Fe-2S family protein
MTAPSHGLEKTLEARYYLSDEVFALEKARIFTREWICVGRSEEVPGPGDFLHLNLFGESALVLRTKDAALRAFYNVCRHRGSQLHLGEATRPGPEGTGCDAGPTSSFPGAIRCPYHSWTYELDGRLRTAPFLSETGGLAKEELGLHPIGLEEWGGFVFLNLSPLEAAQKGYAVTTQIGPVAARIARYPLDDLRIGHRIVYRVAANWKVLAENYNECYHCGPVHPELCQVVPAFREAGGAGLDWDDGIPHRDGAWTFTFSGTTNRAPFPGLSEGEKTRHKGEILYPNLWLSLAADHVAAFTLWPEGPGRTTVVCDFLFHRDERGRLGFDPLDAVEFWDVTNRQDWKICESVQRGMGSRAFETGYFAPMEQPSADIRRYLASRLGPLTSG